MMRINESKMEILLGIFIGALGLTHTSELIYAVGFIFIYAIVLLLWKKFDFKFIKKIVIAGVISLIIAGYNLFIFLNSFVVINPFSFSVSTDWGGTPIFHMTDFGLLLIFLGIGLALGLILFKKMTIPILAGIYMILIGYSNYIGFSIRAFQPRLFWPIYFSFFFGLGLYTLVKFVPSKLRPISVLGLSLLFILILSNVFAIPNVPAYNKVSSSGLMDKPHWESLQWLSKNTPPEARIYFFYGDAYSQDAILRNSKRFHAQVDPEDFVASLQNRTIKRYYKTEFPADHGAGMPYFKSFLKIGLNLKENTESQIWTQIYPDICIFDYYIFDKTSREPVLAQYNSLIANAMLVKNAQIVFENDAVIILKNNNFEGDCIEEGSF